MTRDRNSIRGAFSLVELVVVIIIIGIIAAMAIPRLSRGTAGASDAALSGNLALIRAALNHYAAEHANRFPDGTNVVALLTQYSDAAGTPSATKTAVFIYGPYLAAIPPCPVGNKTSPTAIAIDSANSPPAVTGGSEGWVYNPNTGEFIANSSATDETGRAYNTY